MKKRLMLQCSSNVGRESVRRETIHGIEHIIVTSYTLPNDIVMNGGLYPAEEIEKSYQSLERTLAPVEHPVDSQGNYLSASDPEAIHNFHAGAFNTNVVRDGNRIKVDKYINVQEALKTDRGKRLLDRINELETNDDPRPIHTSVGVFLMVEELDEPKTNAAGKEYNWVASDMVFDHDAILLDSVGAAQPSDGVGMAVNEAGDQFTVNRFVLTPELLEKEVETGDIREEMSFGEISEKVRKALADANETEEHLWIVDLFPSAVIFELGETLFKVPYAMDSNGEVSITGMPETVVRDVVYNPKVNQKGEAMKEAILKLLKANNVETEGLDDAALLEAYNTLLANQSNGDNAGAADDKASDLADIVANALAPITEELASLKTQLNANADNELNTLADTVANSGKYPGLDAESAKLLGVNKLKEMAANCAPSFGVNGHYAVNGTDEHSVKTEMPE